MYVRAHTSVLHVILYWFCGNVFFLKIICNKIRENIFFFPLLCKGVICTTDYISQTNVLYTLLVWRCVKADLCLIHLLAYCRYMTERVRTKMCHCHLSIEVGIIRRISAKIQLVSWSYQTLLFHPFTCSFLVACQTSVFVIRIHWSLITISI